MPKAGRPHLDDAQQTVTKCITMTMAHALSCSAAAVIHGSVSAYIRFLVENDSKAATSQKKKQGSRILSDLSSHPPQTAQGRIQMTEKKKKNKTRSVVSHVSASKAKAETEVKSVLHQMTKEAVSDLKQMNKRMENCTIQQRAGHGAERWHVLTGNQDAVKKGLKDLPFKLTKPGTVGDVTSANARFEVKYHKNAGKTLAEVVKPKYKDMIPVVPSNQRKEMTKIAGKAVKNRSASRPEQAKAIAQTAEKLTDRLSHTTAKGVTAQSKPLTNKKAISNVKNPKNILKTASKPTFKSELAASTAFAAGASGVIATGKGIYDYARGEKSAKDAARDAIVETSKSVAHSAATHAATKAISMGFAKAGAKTLAKGNLAGAIVSCAVEASGGFKDCYDGKISKKECAAKTVRAAAKTGASMAAAEGAATLGMIGGPFVSAAAALIAGGITYSIMSLWD